MSCSVTACCRLPACAFLAHGGVTWELSGQSRCRVQTAAESVVRLYKGARTPRAGMSGGLKTHSKRAPCGSHDEGGSGAQDAEMVDADGGELVGGYSFKVPAHTCDTLPQSAARALEDMGISETSTMGGITFVPDRDAITLFDAGKRCCNRYAWVAPIDEKGSYVLPLPVPSVCVGRCVFCCVFQS